MPGSSALSAASAPSEVRLRVLLRVLAALFLLAAILYEAAPLIPPLSELARHLPFVTNSVVKVTLLGLCCLYAAGDLGRRAGLVVVVLLAHLVSVAAMAVLLVAGAAGSTVEVGTASVPMRTILLGAIALDGVIVLVLGLFALPVLFGRRTPPPPEAEEAGPLTAAERRLRALLVLLAVSFIAAAVGYEMGPLLAATSDLFREAPFVTNSVVKVATLGMLCIYAAGRFRRHLAVVGIVVAAHAVSLLAMLVLALLAPSRLAETVSLGGGTTTIGTAIGLAIVLDGVILALLTAAYLAAWRERFALRFLGPIEFRTLVALADVLVRGDDEPVPAGEVGQTVDRYVERIRAKRRWVYRAALVAAQYHPLLYAKAPLSELSSDLRFDHVRKHFTRDVLLPGVPDWWRRFMQAVLRVAAQLTYVGYYNQPKVFEQIGYVRFREREERAGRAKPARVTVDLTVYTPATLPDEHLLRNHEVCIIGSGAAGAILAYRLAERGRSVLLVERGQFVQPAAFTEDEVDMIGKVYVEGVFQQTEDFRFTILQGSCVGGSTVVNNAVCFDPPPEVLARWNDPGGQDAGLDLAAINDSVRRVRALTGIVPQRHGNLNPSAARVVAAAGQRPTDGRERFGFDVVEANIQDCLGCGYCNIGCAYGRKLSMLDRVLPAAQKLPGRVTVLAEAPVTRLKTLSGRPRRVIEALVTAERGHSTRTLRIEAEKFVVASGAVASPYLLLQSGIGRGLPVGRAVSFNMGAAVTAEFPDVVDAYAGLQISHWFRPAVDRGWVAESWWNPPVAQAVNMPGWFEDHYRHMRRYRRLMAVAALVGTEATATVGRALTGGPGVTFTPGPRDMATLADALKSIGALLFDAGATRAMVNSWRYRKDLGTWTYDAFESIDQLARIDEMVRDPRNMALGTGHPQGGNAISRDPARGVVNESFRVHGYANLHVCDASVFPTSITVNPQLTVMTLADYAADHL